MVAYRFSAYIEILSDIFSVTVWTGDQYVKRLNLFKELHVFL